MSGGEVKDLLHHLLSIIIAVQVLDEEVNNAKKEDNDSNQGNSSNQKRTKTATAPLWSKSASEIKTYLNHWIEMVFVNN